MSSATKKYKLFGLTIWEVEVSGELEATEELEDEEEASSGSMGASLERAGNDVPMFGFIDWKNYPFEDEE
jgi:hypothetical protein